MKTAVNIALLGLASIFLIAIIPACNWDGEIGTEVSPKTCGDQGATRQYIAQIDWDSIAKYTKQEISEEERQKYRREFRESFTKPYNDNSGVKDSFIKTCPCNPDIFLFGIPENVDPVERIAEAKSKTKQSGHAFSNVSFPIPGNDVSVQYDFKPINYKDPEDHLTIAVIDGGLEVRLDEFQTNLWSYTESLASIVSVPAGPNCKDDFGYGYDFTGERFNSIHPHGTKVASVIIDNYPRGTGTNIHLMDLKIFDSAGNGNLFDAVCAIHYAIDFRVDIINISWGYYSPTPDSILYKAIQRATKEGIIVVAAAGNEGVDFDEDNCKFYPAVHAQDNMLNMISVSGLDSTKNELWKYSNHGSNFITLAAPAENISVIHPTIGRGTGDGTSFAAPFITAMVAKMLANGESRSAVASALMTKAVNNQPTPNLDVMTGGKLE